jgi:maltose O-acetyltransferase
MLLLYLANLYSRLSPLTRFFNSRSALYRRCGVRVGQGVKLNGTVCIQYPNVEIGKNTWIGAGTQISSTANADVTIGENCDVSQQVLFVCGTHDIGPTSRRAGRGASSSIKLGDGSWIGARVTFIGGSSVGRGCVVAAGSLVRGSFGDDLLIGGVPARIIRVLPTDNMP